MEENPEIAPLIVDLELLWDNAVDEGIEMANHLLTTLPNLRTLAFQLKHTKEFQPQFLEVNSMENLRMVSLTDNQLSIGTVNRYMNLPRLEQMTIGSRLIGTLEEVDDIQKNSSVRTLELNGHHASPKEIHSLLKLHPGITTLRTPLFGTGDETLVMYDPLCGVEMENPVLSPLQNSKSLAPLRTSLENLQFGGAWMNYVHDCTRMDLSKISSLRFLNCLSVCFFPPGPAAGNTSPRVGFHKLLPPDIEEVTLHLQRNQTIFDETNTTTTTRETQAETSGIPGQLLWLAELASDKMEYTPALKMLRLKNAPPPFKCVKRPFRDANKPLLVPWNDTGVVGNSLAAAGITVEARVRRIAVMIPHVVNHE